MASQRKSRSFRKGFVLGGLVGATAMLWNAPQAGAKTREQAIELWESALFKILDMPARFQSAPASEPVAATPPAPAPAPARPVVPAPESPLGTDIVLDGPRPVEHAV